MKKNQLFTLIACLMASIALASETQTFTYKVIDGLNLTLDVNLPSKSTYDKYPVFFGIHGGGYVEGTKKAGYTNQELIEILSLGYAAISIDYRLNPGVLIGDIVQDVQDAYNFVRTQLVTNITINPDAIVVFGRSAGGGLAVISGYMFDPRPQVVVAFYPYCTNFTDPYVYNPSTPVSQIVIAEANLFRTPVIDEFTPKDGIDPRNILFKTALKEGKGGWLLATNNATETPDTILAVLQNYSAVAHVDKTYPPTYLVHGLNDTLVPYSQSVQLASAVANKLIVYAIDLVPGVGHGFDDSVNDPNSAMWQQHILPAFTFAQDIIESSLEVQSTIISF